MQVTSSTTSASMSNDNMMAMMKNNKFDKTASSSNDSMESLPLTALSIQKQQKHVQRSLPTTTTPAATTNAADKREFTLEHLSAAIDLIRLDNFEDNESLDLEQKRKIILDRLKRLSSHVAGTVLDALIAHMEEQEVQDGFNPTTGKSTLPMELNVGGGSSSNSCSSTEASTPENSDIQDMLPSQGGSLHAGSVISDIDDISAYHPEAESDFDASSSNGSWFSDRLAGDDDDEASLNDGDSSSEDSDDDSGSCSSSVSDDSDSYDDAFDFDIPKKVENGNPSLSKFLGMGGSQRTLVTKIGQTRVNRKLQSVASMCMEGDDYTLETRSFSDEKSAAVHTVGTKSTRMNEVLRHEHHNSAICLVDISGFTNLSVNLDVEALSKNINNYFQMIVDEIDSYGGDVLKFAGDALIVEWRTGKQNDGRKRVSAKQAMIKALACASRIVDKCSDFPVYANGSLVSTLNVHCGLGFGEVVGAHVGNVDRREYLILGKTIQQVAQTMNEAKNGEVVASAEVCRLLDAAVFFEEGVQARGEGTDPPRLVAFKRERYYFPQNFDDASWTPAFQPPCDVVGKRCANWRLEALERLEKLVSSYVHPAVLKNDSENQHSDSELRDVFTAFIQPQMDVDLIMGEEISDDTVERLNQLMQIINSEVTRFKGQVRQFIVDDKGLVVIANFGLRGSTFPNMVEERGIPCISNIKTLVKTELDLDCKIGATYGKAYCGIVGASNRHEYAILGSPVNLSARLMASKTNPGILVDEAVKVKSGNRPFESLEPVKAKGYSDLVKIFKPQESIRKSWKGLADDFVGRKQEMEQIASRVESVLSKKRAEMMLLTAPYGAGKSLLLSHATDHAKRRCMESKLTCFDSCHVFCEEDSFKPFSIIKSLFLDLIRIQTGRTDLHTISMSNQLDDRDLGEMQVNCQLVKLCLEAKIPLSYVEIFGGLIFTKKLSDIGTWADRGRKQSEWNQIANFFVQAFLHVTSKLDLFILALDEAHGVDEMSWKIIELLYQKTSNLLVVSATRSQFDINIHEDFWDHLNEPECENFEHIVMLPYEASETRELVRLRLRIEDQEKEEEIAGTVHILSEGNPLMASEILNKLYLNFTTSEQDLGYVGELLLNRLDSLNASVRNHLNLGALLGHSFYLKDVVAIMQRYNGVQVEDLKSHTESVRACLLEAVDNGILFASVTERSLYTFVREGRRPFYFEEVVEERAKVCGDAAEDHIEHVRKILEEAVARGFLVRSDEDATTFTFSHPFWRENISLHTLDGWKKKMLEIKAKQESLGFMSQINETT